MSFTTDVSFLRIILAVVLVVGCMSQCPLLRTSHFYTPTTTTLAPTATRLNVLYDGRLISTSAICLLTNWSTVSQCPLWRTSHFYWAQYVIWTLCWLSQCPLWRTSHFYTNVKWGSGCSERLNVLYDGRLISTLPLSSSFIQAFFKELFCM